MHDVAAESRAVTTLLGQSASGGSVHIRYGLQRAVHFTQFSLAPATIATYNSWIQRFETFCTYCGISDPLRATGPDFVSFLAYILDDCLMKKSSAQQLDKARAAVSYYFSTRGAVSPTNHPLVARMCQSAARLLTCHTTISREPLLASDMQALIERYLVEPLQRGEQPSLMDSMHVISFLLAFAGMLRYSDLAHVLVNEDFMQFYPDESNPTHVMLFLTHSKTDQARKGSWVAIGATGGVACPVKWLQWLVRTGGYVRNRDDLDCGPLVRPVRRGPGGVHVLAQITSDLQHPIDPLSDTRLRCRLRELLISVGIEKDVGLHSLRIGAATEAALRGVEDEVIMTHGRWRSLIVMRGYCRGANGRVLSSLSSRLGLT